MPGQSWCCSPFVVMFIDLNEHPEIPKNIYIKIAGLIAGLCLMIVLVAALVSLSSQ